MHRDQSLDRPIMYSTTHEALLLQERLSLSGFGRQHSSIWWGSAQLEWAGCDCFWRTYCHFRLHKTNLFGDAWGGFWLWHPRDNHITWKWSFSLTLSLACPLFTPPCFPFNFSPPFSLPIFTLQSPPKGPVQQYIPPSADQISRNSQLSGINSAPPSAAAFANESTMSQQMKIPNDVRKELTAFYFGDSLSMPFSWGISLHEATV